MKDREQMIQRWFDMWLQQQDLGMDAIFSDNIIYIESWGPKYENRQTLKHWFHEWNTRGTVLAWEIKQFFHKDNQTIVAWYFQYKMNHEPIKAFDGLSLVHWSEENKIISLQEFACNLENYNPYKNGEIPEFK